MSGYLRPDREGILPQSTRSRVPVLIGLVPTFEEGGNEGVAFVLDLTERKRAEAEARAMQISGIGTRRTA